MAVAHAGWRGLCDGVLEETVKYFQAKSEDIIVWFGPAIGPKAFQVGIDVVEKFVAVDEKPNSPFKLM